MAIADRRCPAMSRSVEQRIERSDSQTIMCPGTMAGTPERISPKTRPPEVEGVLRRRRRGLLASRHGRPPGLITSCRRFVLRTTSPAGKAFSRARPPGAR
jgi:hypothetical protein